MPQNLRNYNGSPQAKKGSPVCLSHSLKVGCHFVLVYLRMCKSSRGTANIRIFGAKKNGLIPRLTRGDDQDSRVRYARSGQDMKVDLGTEASHGRDMEVTDH